VDLGGGSVKKRTDLQKLSDAWLCGFGLALAEHNRRFGNPDVVVDVMKCAGVTIEKLHHAGLDAYDLKEIKKCLRKPK
jgi:hypothetical protein